MSISCENGAIVGFCAQFLNKRKNHPRFNTYDSLVYKAKEGAAHID